MTEVQKTNPIGSPEEQFTAKKAFANSIGVDVWMVEIAPNGVPRLTASGPSSPHRDNYLTAQRKPWSFKTRDES